MSEFSKRLWIKISERGMAGKHSEFLAPIGGIFHFSRIGIFVSRINWFALIMDILLFCLFPCITYPPLRFYISRYGMKNWRCADFSALGVWGRPGFEDLGFRVCCGDGWVDGIRSLCVLAGASKGILRFGYFWFSGGKSGNGKHIHFQFYFLLLKWGISQLHLSFQTLHPSLTYPRLLKEKKIKVEKKKNKWPVNRAIYSPSLNISNILVNPRQDLAQLRSGLAPHTRRTEYRPYRP